jgi:AcrR family transcriptional regulator
VTDTVLALSRAQRTREKLLRAFVELFHARGFQHVSARDIAARAGVGRSTLYTHFGGPLEVLEASFEGACRMLADAVRVDTPSARLVPLLEHFRSQWHHNRDLFQEPIRSIWSRCLARAISDTLRHDPNRARHRPALPREWLAPALADLQLAIIRRWLAEPLASAASASEVAVTLGASSRRLVTG